MPSEKPNTKPALTIRTLETIGDYLESEAVQQSAWQINDSTQVIPLHVLLTAQKNGGLVAGAFNAEGHMVGVIFGFIGLSKDGKFKHCSHIMGIVPEVRRQNVGYALKLFQRDYVRKQGLDLVTWTYDPLEGVNASLNIGKLGGTVRTYFDNLYGQSMGDALNAGLPTDRFEVEWWINHPRTQAFIDATTPKPSAAQVLSSGGALLNQTERDEMGALHITSIALDLTHSTVLLEIPPDFQAVKKVSIEAAQLWRAQTGSVFRHYFSRGYQVTDFLSDQEAGGRRNYYVLTHTSA